MSVHFFLPSPPKRGRGEKREDTGLFRGAASVADQAQKGWGAADRVEGRILEDHAVPEDVRLFGFLQLQRPADQLDGAFLIARLDFLDLPPR